MTIETKKEQLMKEFIENPFIGHDSFEDARKDYKFTSQADVLSLLLDRKNVMISGPAGSGKTTIINRFIELIKVQFDHKFEVAVTASTGIAATLLGGQTIHSWAGLGISTDPFDSKKLPPSYFFRRKFLKHTDVLIIDEISMLPAYLFEKLDAILRYTRRNNKPFGGIQLVLLGDFMQLPPVRTSGTDESINTDFVITTPAWKEAGITYCYMDKTHRATDKKLKYSLAHIAANKVNETTKDLIESRLHMSKDPSKTYATLYTTNANVDKYNHEQLMKNPNQVRRIMALETGPRKEIEEIYKKYNISKEIEFKKDATVILTSNITDETTGAFYANGSIGKIVDFISDDIKVKFNDGTSIFISKKEYVNEKKKIINLPDGEKKVITETTASVVQTPLKLGYAITVHKSQGQTFDGVVADLSKCFTPGLGYVALSRVRSLDDLILTNLSDKAYQVNERSLKISRYVKKQALKTREEIISNQEYYENLLKDDKARSLKWDVSKAGGPKILAS